MVIPVISMRTLQSVIEDAIPEEVVRVFAAFDREPPLLRWAPSSADIRDRRLERLENRSNRDSLGAADVIQDSG
ncbi:MAG: hypothetical protein SF002_17675 [Alphaproteobacteria bacterium]|nr:hypothetical protein [Alphaproteobacteria bacterium]